MKLTDFYKTAIELAKKHDPRKKNKTLSYPDSRILYGDPEVNVRKIMVGIDIEVAELLLADKIKMQEGLDLVVSHHPEGMAYVLLHEVMQLQVDLLKDAGMSGPVAQKFLDQRKQEVERRILPQNHTRAVDAAKLLGIPFMCLHTVADNHVFSFIKDTLAKEKPKRVSDVIDILMEIPEYRGANEYNAGPRIILGSPKRETGKVIVEMTGGTEGSKDVFDKLYKTGVRTLVSMHLSEEHLKKVKEANLNVVIAGHISSDTLGLNLLLDGIEKKAKETFQVVNCSGFKRIKRN